MVDPLFILLSDIHTDDTERTRKLLDVSIHGAALEDESTVKVMRDESDLVIVHYSLTTPLLGTEHSGCSIILIPIEPITSSGSSGPAAPAGL